MSFHEIYKCLRDGLYSQDKDYKHLCLDIILRHLYYISQDVPGEMSESTLRNIKELTAQYHPDLISPASEEPQGKDSSF